MGTAACGLTMSESPDWMHDPLVPVMCHAHVHLACPPSVAIHHLPFLNEDSFVVCGRYLVRFPCSLTFYQFRFTPIYTKKNTPTNSPPTLTGAGEQFPPARATFRSGLASESQWLQPLLVLTVRWWPGTNKCGWGITN